VVSATDSSWDANRQLEATDWGLFYQGETGE